MKVSYYVDSNVILRFLLADNKRLHRRARNRFELARKGEVKLVILPEIVIEVNYVLLSIYSISKGDVARELAKLAQSPYLEVVEREALINAIDKYRKLNVDLIDLLLYERAKAANAQVLSFDETDMRKIRRQDEARLI